MHLYIPLEKSCMKLVLFWHERQQKIRAYLLTLQKVLAPLADGRNVHNFLKN